MEVLEFIKAMPQQITAAKKYSQDCKADKEVNDIVIAGMGTGAIAGELLKEVLKESKYIVRVHEGYGIPSGITSKTLFFAISYSGDTEEVLESAKSAYMKGAQVITITSGGKLRDFSRQKNLNSILIPKGIPPRFAFSYLFFPLLFTLQNSEMIKSKAKEIDETVLTLQSSALEKQAESIATWFEHCVPIIYTSPSLNAIGRRWKQALNENAKTHSFHVRVEDLYHHELMAYTGKQQAEFYILILSKDSDDVKTRRKMQYIKDTAKKAGVGVTEVMISGASIIEKSFFALLLGDLVSYKLAKHYKVDPYETHLLDDFRRTMR